MHGEVPILSHNSLQCFNTCDGQTVQSYVMDRLSSHMPYLPLLQEVGTCILDLVQLQEGSPNHDSLHIVSVQNDAAAIRKIDERF